MFDGSYQSEDSLSDREEEIEDTVEIKILDESQKEDINFKKSKEYL